MSHVELPQSESLYAHEPAALARFLEDLEQHLRTIREAAQTRVTPARSRATNLGQQPQRLTLLDALADLGYPTVSRTLRVFIAARYGVDIPTRQFGSLAVQERIIFDRSGVTARPVWLASGLTADGFQPVKRIWGRSDWPDAWRIITPHSDRIQHLHATEALCRLAVNAGREARDPAALRELALAHAEELPGVAVRREEPDFTRYANLAQFWLQKHEQGERHAQEEAAVALATLPDRVRLFGAEERKDRDIETADNMG